MTEALALGVLFGVGAGLAVGPIFITIVHESLTRGIGAGLRVILGSAVADVILMLPALAATWLIARVDALSVLVALAGGAYFIYLAIQAVRESRRLWRNAAVSTTRAAGWAFAKGVVGNLLNPLTWTFWLATGTPTMLRVYRGASWPGLIAFTATWFIVAMAIETLVAAAVAQTRRVMSHRALAGVQAVSAVTFFAVAATLVFGRT